MSMWMLGVLALLVLLPGHGALICYKGNVTLSTPEVTISQGKLVGKIMATVSQRRIYGFIGIPFAKPPVGDLRFRGPVEHEGWPGVWNAVESPRCAQFFPTTDTFKGSEDCLYINVYTPQMRNFKKKPFPVIVNIHGGSFTNGHGTEHSPQFLLDQDLVFVTFNYRLGILGFLSTEDDVVPGNNGLKDQTLALKWVQKNIGAFNGDPNRIVLTGFSAGATSGHYQILSKMSRGLFSRAVILSGSALCPWSLRDNPRQKAEKVARQLNCPTEDSQEMIECLRTKTANEITMTYGSFPNYIYGPYGHFGPVIEPSGPNAFLDKKPIDIIERGEAADIPTIYSITSDEGMSPGEFILKNKIFRDQLESDWYGVLQLLLDYDEHPSQYDKTGRAITKHYFGVEGLPNVMDNPKALIDMIGDRLYTLCTVRAALLHAKRYKSPIYMSKFSFRSRYSIKNRPNVYEGANHGDDALYIMNHTIYSVIASNQSLPIVRKMTKLWKDFADGTELPCNWPKMQNGLPAVTYLEIMSPTENRIRSEINIGNEQFWTNLGL